MLQTPSKPEADMQGKRLRNRDAAGAGGSARAPLRVAFCAWMVAGVQTQYENVRAAAAATPDVELRALEIQPFRRGGALERLPLLGKRTKGTLRSLACALPLLYEPVDVVWSQVDTPILPFILTRARRAGIPYAISTDATTAQVEGFPEYARAGDGPSLKHRLRDRLAGYAYRHAALALPWSRWAADAIRAQFGLPEERVRVLPPGVHLPDWPLVERAAPADRPTRLLFVGGDFARKGGPLLLDVYRRRLRGRVELHLVTREPVAPEPGVFVYESLSPNAPELRRLYADCDALVLPTRADCFSLAAMEAMATGLPVIISAVGGIPEIVADGESGWLLPVGDGAALLAAIEALLADPARARAMGRRGRALVEERFDAAKNTRRALELLRAVRPRRER